MLLTTQSLAKKINKYGTIELQNPRSVEVNENLFEIEQNGQKISHLTVSSKNNNTLTITQKYKNKLH